MPSVPDKPNITWDELYGRPLNDAEKAKIQSNLCSFYKMLNEWSISDGASQHPE